MAGCLREADREHLSLQSLLLLKSVGCVSPAEKLRCVSPAEKLRVFNFVRARVCACVYLCTCNLVVHQNWACKTRPIKSDVCHLSNSWHQSNSWHSWVLRYYVPYADVLRYVCHQSNSWHSWVLAKNWSGVWGAYVL